VVILPASRPAEGRQVGAGRGAAGSSPGSPGCYGFHAHTILHSNATDKLLDDII